MDFEDRFDSLLELYSTGLDIRQLCLRNDGGTAQITIQKKWHKLNVSFNYIGEFLDIKKTIFTIKKMRFENNFINLFTNKGKVFAIVSSNLFEADKSAIENSSIVNMIKVTKYQGDM